MTKISIAVQLNPFLQQLLSTTWTFYVLPKWGDKRLTLKETIYYLIRLSQMGIPTGSDKQKLYLRTQKTGFDGASEWEVRRKMQGAWGEGVSVFVCGDPGGQKGGWGEGAKKQIHKSQPDFQKCENLYKTISSNNWQDWIDEKQRRRSERQSRATEWAPPAPTPPPIHFQISSSTVPCTLLITGQAFPCHLFTHNKRPVQTHRWNMPAAWGSRPIMALSWAYFCLPPGGAQRVSNREGGVGGVGGEEGGKGAGSVMFPTTLNASV